MLAQGVEVDADPQNGSALLGFLFQLLPVILIVGAFIWIMNQSQGGGGRVMPFGKAEGEAGPKDQPKTTFADVAGVDEAIEELQEVKEYLQNPAKFQAMGAKIPRGVLLFGPPGTGKTLLARAVAGEAGVPFYSISGSDFVEMFVGVGAARVRDLFEQAKQNAPAIVFIDEIDAVGRHRGAGLGGGHDEREQTLNQLLVEMDGFDQRTAVILMAATNRPDILDPALLRPGPVRPPDRRRPPRPRGPQGHPAGPRPRQAAGRGRGPRRHRPADARLHRRGPGERDQRGRAAGGAVEQEGHRDVGDRGGHRPGDGRPRAQDARDERAREADDRVPRGGHALVAHVLPNTDPVHKISVIPRGRALGYTLTLPEEDKFLVTREELIDELAMLLGGRVAEEIMVGDITTGAANDIERATKVARQMVTEYGMSDVIGPSPSARSSTRCSSGATSRRTPTTPSRSRSRSTTRSAA